MRARSVADKSALCAFIKPLRDLQVSSAEPKPAVGFPLQAGQIIQQRRKLRRGLALSVTYARL